MAKHMAIQVVGFNVEDPTKGTQFVTVETPKPGRNEVLIKMLYRPINPSDVLFLQGEFPGASCPSFVGFEGMGIIHEVGEDVAGLTTGQRVFCYKRECGTWQEYMVASVNSMLVPIPDSVPDEVAAQFFGNPWTVYGMLEQLKIPPGEYVLQTAAGSVLGRMFIQLAHHRGIKTINLVRRNEQREELKAIGADIVINYKEEDVVEQVKKITGGKMAYAAIDCVCGDLTKTVASSVRDCGTMLVYGSLDDSSVRIDVVDLIFRDVKAYGFSLGRYVAKLNPVELKEVEANVMELLEKKIIEPLVGEKFQLERFREAILKSKAAARGGKILLTSH